MVKYRSRKGGVSLFPYKSPSGDRYRLYRDMLEKPHLLIAGATGSGKSVVINALVYTALYNFPDDQSGGAQFILIDAKEVELLAFRNLPHTITHATEREQIRNALLYAVDLMGRRYKEMRRRGEKQYSGGHVYIIIDEFADLMTTDKNFTVPLLQRIAQKGRAANIHLILATQTPHSDIIPTKIKCNFDYRVGLRTGSAQDSRNILGVSGCELLPDPKQTGTGYGYYKTGADCELYQFPMYTDEEIKSRVEWWTKQKSPLRRLLNRSA